MILMWVLSALMYLSSLQSVPSTSSGGTTASPCDVAADAQLIVNSNRAELIVMRIIPFRSFEQRKNIDGKVRQLGVTPLVETDYKAASAASFQWTDLCFVLLTQDKNTILSRFMPHFFKRKNENVIINIMLLVDDMSKFIEAYNAIDHQHSFDKGRKDQRKPFQNMLRVWAESTRPPDSTIDQAAVDKEANALLDEKPKWDKTRDHLEKILMKSSYAMANATLAKYEEKNKHPIEDDIRAVIKNHDLVDAYCSLATYIKDKYECLARKIHEQSNGKDRFATWMILVGILKPAEWTEINARFKKNNDNIGIVEFISRNIVGDFVVMECLAYLIDQTYKPKFLAIPAPIATLSAAPLPLLPSQPTPTGASPHPARQDTRTPLAAPVPPPATPTTIVP